MATRATATWTNTDIELFEAGDQPTETDFRRILERLEYLAQVHAHGGDPGGAVLAGSTPEEIEFWTGPDGG